jgi:predicted acylesterase/phospholipase RssA
MPTKPSQHGKRMCPPCAGAPTDLVSRISLGEGRTKRDETKKLITSLDSGLGIGVPDMASEKFLAWVRLTRIRFDLKARPVFDVLVALRTIWPVSLAVMGIMFCFVLPGLASEQFSEAMLAYISVGTVVHVIWSRYLLTLYVAATLGVVLVWSADRLLDSRTTALAPTTRRSLTVIIGSIPTLAVAFGFFSLQGDMSVQRYPNALMAAGLILTRPIYTRLGNLGRFIFVEAPLTNWLSSPFARAFLWALPVIVLVSFILLESDKPLLLQYSTVVVSQALGPINIIILSFAAWTAALSSVILLSRKTRIPIIAACVILIVANNAFDLNDNHPIRRVGRTEPANPVLIENAFYDWLDTRPDRNEFAEYPIIIVSAEGGGIRAAFFAAITLARIVDRCPRAASHIFAISGVSGGALGAAIYAAAMKARPPNTTEPRCDLQKESPRFYENAFYKILTDDHLSPLLIRMISTDAIQQLLPFPVDRFDRQLGLEWSFERSFRRVFDSGVFSESLYQLRPTEKTPAVPYLYINVTRVENGHRVIISPIYNETEEAEGGIDDWHAIDYWEAPAVSAAAGASARFPVVSPPGYYVSRSVLTNKPNFPPDPNYRGLKNRYVDGGYFDNSSTPTLMELYRYLYSQREQEIAEGHESPFSIISLQIGNAPVCDRSAARGTVSACKDDRATSKYSGFLSEILAPFDAVINVRDARVEYSISEFEAEIAAAQKPSLGPPKIPSVERNKVQMLDRGIPAPLGWLLSERAATELASQLDAPSDFKNCDKPSNSCNLDFTVERIRAKQ